jgi:methyl-accepting chemotaxis protein
MHFLPELRMSNDLNVRLQFIQMDDATRALLREMRPMIAQLLPGILDGFYRVVRQYDQTNRLFRDESHIRHAKDAQVRHWDMIAQGTFDSSYFESATRIGKAHQRIGLEPRWYIGGYSFLMSELLKAIELSIPMPRFGKGAQAVMEKKAAMLAAITKAALLDMDLAISIYLEASVSAKKDTIDRVGRTFRDIIDSVSSASTELESTAQVLTGTAENTTRLTSVVATASEDASSNVQSVASATEELAASVREISRQVQESSRIATSAVEQAEQTDGRINALSQAASRIGDVVKLITAIAEQTNLLALNATIEAARAGEAGRGFAVVASEVKALAAQTAKATDEIGSQIAGMQTATQEAVGSIKMIGSTIGRISEITAAIASAIEEQGAATQEIASNIQRAAQGTTQVAGTIAEVNHGAVETGSASGQVLTSAKELAQTAEKLRAEVEGFLSTVAAAA